MSRGLNKVVVSPVNDHDKGPNLVSYSDPQNTSLT